MGVYGYFNRPVYDDDTEIRRIWDLEEIKNVVNKFSFYMANKEREAAIEKCWVSDKKYTDTASYGKNWGYYVGLNEVKRFLLNPERTNKFLSGQQTMTSWVVEQAHNDNTAQGIWYSIWYEINRDSGAYWHGAKVGIDFVKEADGWKIWHYFMGVDIFCRPGEDFGNQPCTISPEYALVDPMQEDFGDPTISMEAYSAKYNWSHYPPLPTPHNTYEDTVSCGPTGNPNYKQGSRMA